MTHQREVEKQEYIEEVKRIINDYASNVFYSGDPMREGSDMDEETAVDSIMKIITSAISEGMEKERYKGRQEVRRELKDWTKGRTVTKESLRQKLNTLKKKI